MKACALVDLNRSLYYYHLKKPKVELDKRIVQKILILRQRHPTIGAKKLAKLLSDPEYPVNHKKVARILSENQLGVKKKRRQRNRIYNLERIPTPKKITHSNQLWSIDFMCARKTNAFKFSLLNVVDVASRVAPIMIVERSFTSFDVTDELDKAIELQGAPEGIVTDNGCEFTGAHFRIWCKRRGIQHYLTNKGSPAENCFVESFNSCVRREVLDTNDFKTMNELRIKIEKWRLYYNQERPHGSLGYASPEKYINLLKNTELAV